MNKRIERKVTGAAILQVPLGVAELVGFEKDRAEGGKIKIEQTSVTHVNINIGQECAERFLQIRNGLRAEGAVLSNGREVVSNADVFRWILENMTLAEEQPEEPQGKKGQPKQRGKKPANSTPLQTAADL